MATRAAIAPVLLTVLLAAAAVLVSGAALPRVALALTLETPMTNPDGSPNFADDQNPKYDRFRNNLSGQVMADVKSFLGDKVYETVIPRNVRISEAPSYGKPALLYDLRCSGSQAYLRLASEVIKRERALRAAA